MTQTRVVPSCSMGRSVSPLLKHEFENLEKDSDARRSAMRAIKSYVRELDSKSIPQFLAQVSEVKEPNSSSCEYTISLYEVLARVHGKNIVPQIRNIMSTIISTLTSSAGSFPLHQACAKVVPAIARYGIDPLSPDNEKAAIISSLARPLSEVLMSQPDSLASGAALCLKALVECDNWRFASDQSVNMVCLNLSGALEEKMTQTHSHMVLAMSLAKSSPLILEGYARSLIRSAIEICKVGESDSSVQKRLNAIQMINSILKHVDPSSISSELEEILVFLEKFRADRLMFIRSAASEALLNARTIAAEKKLKINSFSSTVNGSNLSSQRKDCSLSPYSAESAISYNCSPRSATLGSPTVASFVTSPVSSAQSFCNFGRPTNRRLCLDRRGVVDVSLKDGLHPSGLMDIQIDSTSNYTKDNLKHLIDEDVTHVGTELSDFSGFGSNSETLEAEDGTQKNSYPPIPIDDIKIFTTPRKLIRSLQSHGGEFSALDKESRDCSSHVCNGGVLIQPKKVGDGVNNGLNYGILECKCLGATSVHNEGGDVSVRSHKMIQSTSAHQTESVFSTDGDHLEGACAMSHEVIEETNASHPTTRRKMGSMKHILCLTLFVLLISVVVMFTASWESDNKMYDNLVPT